MGTPERLYRISQGETQEARDAVAMLRDPVVQEERERRLEALSHAQGGRWLESSTVEREGSRGYGGPGHTHRPQHKTPEAGCQGALCRLLCPPIRLLLLPNRRSPLACVPLVACSCSQSVAFHQNLLHRPHLLAIPTQQVRAALEGRASPEFREADEKLREARAEAQGGRWMDEGNTPAGRPSQQDQPEVQAALQLAADPAVQEERERKRAARAAAQGGRWLD